VKEFLSVTVDVPGKIRKFTFINWGTLLVVQLVEALHYKSEGCEFEYRWCHCNFSMT
jgi:hypothetical protein